MRPTWRYRMDVGRKNTAADKWRERVKAQQGSGQSIRAWCREHGCHEHAFYWWRCRLGLSPVGAKRRGRPRITSRIRRGLSDAGGSALIIIAAGGGDDIQSRGVIGGRGRALA